MYSLFFPITVTIFTRTVVKNFENGVGGMMCKESFVPCIYQYNLAPLSTNANIARKFFFRLSDKLRMFYGGLVRFW